VRLTAEAREALRILALSGHSASEIRERTGVAISTIRDHCREILNRNREARNRERDERRAQEVAVLRRMVERGRSMHATAKMTGRSKDMVRRYCGDLKRERGEARCLEVLRVVESSTLPRAVLAHDLGYANEATLAVILTRARKIRKRRSD
jgi:transposase